MKRYKFEKVYENIYGCEVDAETFEEAEQKAEEADWYESGENYLTMSRWKCIDLDEDLEEGYDEDDIEEGLDQIDWEVM